MSCNVQHMDDDICAPIRCLLFLIPEWKRIDADIYMKVFMKISYPADNLFQLRESDN